MMTEISRYLASPLLGHLLTTAGLCLALYLFFSVARQLRALETRYERLTQSIEQSGAGWRSSLAQAETRLADLERHAGLMVPPTPPRSGMNLNKRTQAIRLMRLGEPPERIAAALQIQPKEVELLMKVQRTLAMGASASS